MDVLTQELESDSLPIWFTSLSSKRQTNLEFSAFVFAVMSIGILVLTSGVIIVHIVKHVLH